MKKKLGLIILLGSLLVGCTSNPAELKTEIEKAVAIGIELAPFNSPNHFKPTFAYYLPNNVGVIDSNDHASLLKYQNYQIIMNLNVPAIVAEKHYQKSQASSFLKTDYFYHQTGLFQDYQKQAQKYDLTIFKLEGPFYYLRLETNYLTYLAATSLAEMPDLAIMLLSIVKTVEVDRDQVVQLYSRKLELKDAQISTLPPKTEGYLLEMLDGYDYEFNWHDYNDVSDEQTKSTKPAEDESTEDDVDQSVETK